jgi:agmatine deiminase
MDRLMSREQLSNATSAVSNYPTGFQWVAEWEPHAATWISWPHNEETWPGRFTTIPSVSERMIRILADVEQVHVLGGPPSAAKTARQQLRDCANVTVHDIPTNDCWIRDFGPTFLLSFDSKRLGAVRWRFNAWGGKYPCDYDADANARICDLLDNQGQLLGTQGTAMDSFASAMICEGGGLDTDGRGTLMTTSSCLLSSTRNFRWTREMVESELMRMLSIRKVLWVDGGALAGDDTDSHIDQLVRFVRPGVVVAAVSYSTDDSNAPKLAAQKLALESMTDADDRPLTIVPIPTPPPRLIQGKRVPESYCNFYIANQVVIVPTFGFRETDERALGQLRELFSDRDIVPLDASDFIWGLGAFHCATQQQPAILS